MSHHFPPADLKESVYSALAFFDQFDCPLTIDELERYIMAVTVDRPKLLEFLTDDEKIGGRDGFFFLKGRQGIVNFRKVRREIAQKYWRKVRFFVPLARIVPYIRMVAVCNTLAFDNPTSKSDIDLFVITRRGRIFTARSDLTLFYSLLGVRRHGQKIAGRFCLSFFLAEDSLNLEQMRKDEKDAYLYYWFRSLVPVFGHEYYRKFINENGWLKDSFIEPFRNARQHVVEPGKIPRFIGFIKELFLNLPPGNWIEAKLRSDHLKRHDRRTADLGPESDVVIADHMLKYHNIDRRSEFNRKFFAKYAELLG